MNRYLQDGFAPVADELTAFDLPVTGALPEHLDGRYLRIGPNPAADPGEDYHWFLGEGMVHGVRIEDGAARWYRNRWVRPESGDFAPNTNVVQHRGRTMALVEAGAPPYELSEELETVGRCGFAGDLAAGYTAHPHEDPATGELHAVSYSWTRGNRVDYSVLDTSGRIRRQVEVEVHGSPMMHDFALTEHYAVIFDLPVTFDIDMVAGQVPRPVRLAAKLALNSVVGRNPMPDRVVDAMARGAGTPSKLPYSWDPDYPARVGLLPREGAGTDVRWFEIDPCYVFHTLNAFEDGDDVVIDVVRHPRMFATDFTGPHEGPSSLVRLTVDTVAGKVREHRYDEQTQEFPRLDERRTGRRHRYGWSVGFDGVTLGDSVLLHDVQAGTTHTRRLGPGKEVGEFCFVPDADDAAEGAGVVMGYVHDRSTARSDLVLLDAQTLEDVATVHLPGRVPAGFHGNWAPAGG
ncbi:carotenoid oxygenase family protein [Nocardioides sp. cx-173]|uniref:carotenoid oxygenase family protein n=1 Tax=Nocardioides sp. cx-173 TaxID=2898796 RepID=UPI001E41F680|nr:carotenoid oxygenase family protein [Nocardioides sp. cx-173]MCD4523903.1 carotenoid oxygenase family protein [Nocardioides sp. cx-173]UGB41778.1 carotenoid oxygenase family protein [Nocardioides sp. cx-173]